MICGCHLTTPIQEHVLSAIGSLPIFCARKFSKKARRALGKAGRLVSDLKDRNGFLLVYVYQTDIIRRQMAIYSKHSCGYRPGAALETD